MVFFALFSIVKAIVKRRRKFKVASPSDMQFQNVNVGSKEAQLNKVSGDITFILVLFVFFEL